MMYTIRPKNDSIVAWLLKYGIEIKREPLNYKTADDHYTYVAVCLTRATNGPILRVCYNHTELRNARIACANHSGPCRWYWVAIDAVKPFMLGEEIK